MRGLLCLIGAGPRARARLLVYYLCNRASSIRLCAAIGYNAVNALRCGLFVNLPHTRGRYPGVSWNRLFVHL